MNMENALIINGEKIEITEEDAKRLKSQIKTSGKLSDLNVSSAFYIGKHEFVVLEHLEDGKTIVILKNLLFEEKQFGKNNNYDGSIVDDLCNDFGSEIEKIVGGDALCEFTLDLTADDGLKCYGSVKRKMALPTANTCRKYVDILDKHKIGKWWWTSTAYSTPKHKNESWVKCVSPHGVINNDIFSNDNGVRPFGILKSNIFVSK